MRSSHQSTLQSEIQKESNFGIERKFIHSEFNNRSVTKNNIYFFNTFKFIYDMPGHRSAVTHAASTVAELAQAITGPEPDFISQTDRRSIISDTDLANMLTFQSGPKLLKQLDTVGNGRFPHPGDVGSEAWNSIFTCTLDMRTRLKFEIQRVLPEDLDSRAYKLRPDLLNFQLFFEK